ncbi:MAG: MSHA biogenesis protein MshP [Shewanella sp.]|nr:MSHA biogenesis protein MshP [Shewanella sp.]
MFPNATYSYSYLSSRLPSRQKGSMLVVAIFVLTVMFLLAAALINISQNEDKALTQEVWGTRALFAANSGADAALAQLFPLNGNEHSCNEVSENWSAPDVVGFANCAIEIGCQSFTADNVTQYRISSKAVCKSGSGSDQLRVSRQVEVLAKQEG